MSDSKSPACAATDQLEAAILRKKPLRVKLRETVDLPAQTQEVDPLDIRAEGGAEFLHYRIRRSGLETKVRLDRILKVEEI